MINLGINPINFDLGRMLELCIDTKKSVSSLTELHCEMLLVFFNAHNELQKAMQKL